MLEEKLEDQERQNTRKMEDTENMNQTIRNLEQKMKTLTEMLEDLEIRKSKRDVEGKKALAEAEK